MKNIKLTLKKIDPIKWATIAAILYAVIALIVVVPMFLIFSTLGAASAFEDAGVGFGFFGGGLALLFIPIIYGVLGFIFGLIGALVLNFVLKKVNGLDMDFETAGLEVTNGNS